MALIEEALPKALWDLPLPSPAHASTSAERLSLKVCINAFRVHLSPFGCPLLKVQVKSTMRSGSEVRSRCSWHGQALVGLATAQVAHLHLTYVGSRLLDSVTLTVDALLADLGTCPSSSDSLLRLTPSACCRSWALTQPSSVPCWAWWAPLPQVWGLFWLREAAC